MAQTGQAPAGFPEGLITYNISKAAAAPKVQRLLFAWDDFECAPLAYGLRHPASASCLGRHSRLAGRCPNNSSLFPPLAAVVVVAAHIQRKDYFIFRNTGASADAPVFHFHRWGRNEKRQLQRRFLRKRGAAGYPLRLTTFARFPKGTPYGNVGNFAAATEAFTHRGKVARSAG